MKRRFKYFWVLEGGGIQFKSLKCEVSNDTFELLTILLRGQSVSAKRKDRSLSAYYRDHCGLKPSSEKIKNKRGKRLLEKEEEEVEREDSNLHQWYN